MSVAKDDLFYNLGQISVTREEKHQEALSFRLSKAKTKSLLQHLDQLIGSVPGPSEPVPVCWDASNRTGPEYLH